jgi:choline dehydrogenase-like flavoprotein
VSSYYGAACTICGVPPFDDQWELSKIEPSSLLPDSPQFFSLAFHQNLIHFGEQYGEELRRSPRIKVVLHATVTEIVAATNGRVVERVRAASLAGRELTVRARVYVLAAGGLENARLLLISNGARPKGLGNDHDQVGRYFMEHPHVPVGRVVLWRPPRAIGFYLDFQNGPTAGTRVALAVRLKDDVIRARRLRNGNFTFVPLQRPFDASRMGHADFLQSEVLEMHPLLKPPRASAEGFDDWYRAYAEQTALFASVSAVARDLDGTRSPSTDPNNPSLFRGMLYARTEQAPNAESRVTLSDERDPFDHPRLRVRWQLTDADISSIVESARILGREFGRLGVGRVQALIEPAMKWPIAGGGFHHMGTTRMHRDPAQGVTDVNCGVHGVSNLYVAGSSVFPTCGHANPTLTVIALALRLTDHLVTIL